MKRSPDGYHPAPNYIESIIRINPQLHDSDFPIETLTPLAENTKMLITPETIYGRRVVYEILEFDPLLDSSSMGLSDWVTIASTIGRYYDTFGAFVVLHGTDTMAYTASALSFMLENLRKSVVLTGSQVPLVEQRNDARENFLTALLMAGHFNIPEVMLCFNNTVFRGNRTFKASAMDYEAFESPNFAPLAKAAVSIDIDWSRVFRPTELKSFSVWTKLSPNVGSLRLFPGVSAATVRAFLQPPTEGVVLETFGAGNAPEKNTELLEALAEASNRGVVIVNCTQCHRGSVTTDYTAGSVLKRAGVVSGGDMTTGCALAKLCYLLGKGLPIAEVRQLVSQNLRGELTDKLPQVFSFDNTEFIRGVAKYLNTDQRDETRAISKALLPTLMCAAAAKGQLMSLMEMLDQGADVNIRDYDHRTPLHVAASQGHIEIVRFLLKHGANTLAIDRHNRTALEEAIAGRHSAVIKLLRQTGAVLPSPSWRWGEALCQAAAANDATLIGLLLAAGVDVNTSTQEQRTALHRAAWVGNQTLVAFLIKHGADVDCEDGWGRTPTDDALANGHNDVVELIAKAKEKQAHNAGK
eukprot:c20420_g2_i1.p1 GENE.c20420_g2_i1~~c20420_g2_i1.p1  ORF type:complete len:581 (-),score=119.52 c20420_g2_i1:68-1810(-)